MSSPALKHEQGDAGVADLSLDVEKSLGSFTDSHWLESYAASDRVFALVVKRFMDVVLASVLLILAAPIMVAIGVAIKLESEGPILYRSRRLGRMGRLFWCCKFRTMVCNAEAMRAHLEHLNEREKILFKINNDPRTTGLGRFLRKYSLDELPQLWNVLAGHMSLIGPRPPVPEEFKQYERQHRKRLTVKPGLTGLWQVTARQDPSFERYIQLDLQYIEEWNFWLDMKILWKTIPAVVRGTGS
jgi:lipopolysaccharide/colanic/teichoic acid biosynthesis glycosyltransferase